jgi:hypothetical protein
MPDDLNNNQSNNINRRPHEGREHETHWTALILLALGSLVVIVVVLLAAQNQPETPPETTTTTQVDQESHGSVIPAEQVQTQKQSGLSGFPEGMYLPDDREIVRNFSADLTDTTQQRVVIFDTDTSIQDLKDGFRQWLDQSSFTETDTSETTIRSENGSEQLVMSISETDDSRRVQVNYLTDT